MDIFPALTPQHLQHATKVLSQAKGNLRQDAARRRAAIAETLICLILFGAVLALETGMAAMMFSLLQVEVLGHVVSGAAFDHALFTSEITLSRHLGRGAGAVAGLRGALVACSL